MEKLPDEEDVICLPLFSLIISNAIRMVQVAFRMNLKFFKRILNHHCSVIKFSRVSIDLHVGTNIRSELNVLQEISFRMSVSFKSIRFQKLVDDFRAIDIFLYKVGQIYIDWGNVDFVLLCNAALPLS